MMVSRLFIFLPLFVFAIGSRVLPAAAQFPAGARSTALGGAATGLLAEIGLETNPATWSAVEHVALGFDAVQWYGMSELRAGSAQLVWPTSHVSIVIGAQTFGFELYRETAFVLGVAATFQPGTFRTVYVGVKLKHSMIRIEGYGTTSYPAASAGILIPVLPSVALGAAATNLVVVGPSVRSEIERSLSIGASYTHGSRVMLATDLVKEVRSPPAVRFGVEMRPVAALALRAGLTTEPPRVTGGVGVRTSHIVLDVAGERHYALGWSPVTSVRIQW